MTGLWAPEDFVPEHIAAVDIATENLLPDAALAYRGKSEICIDHHPPTSSTRGRPVWTPGRRACGEIIYRICRALDVMNAAIAKQLYIAITTDCGLLCLQQHHAGRPTARGGADDLRRFLAAAEPASQTVSQDDPAPEPPAGEHGVL